MKTSKGTAGFDPMYQLLDIAVCELEPRIQGTRQMFALLFLNAYIEQVQLDASVFRYGHNLVGVKTPRPIRVGDFPLLHDYSVAFNQRLQNYEGSKLSTNPAVACWHRSTLCLGIARGWQTTLADCQRDLRGTSEV